MEGQLRRLVLPAPVRLQLNTQAVSYSAHVIEQRGNVDDIDDVFIVPAYAAEFIDPVLGDASGCGGQKFSEFQHGNLFDREPGVVIVLAQLLGQF